MKRANQVGAHLMRLFVRVVVFVGAMAAFGGTATAQVQCWAPMKEWDSVATPKFAGTKKALLGAADVLKRDAAYLTPPEPVRMRVSIHAGPYAESGARLFVDAIPEKNIVGIELWEGQCGVIRQIDELGSAIGNIGVYFNYDPRDYFLKYSDVPKQTGTVGGFPEYNGYVVISKNGRLPWIPKTLNDKLDELEKERAERLKTWNEQKAARKIQDPASVQKTYEMLKKNDPKGAEGYLKSMKDLEEQIKKAKAEEPAIDAEFQKQLDDLRKYRASFAAAQLASPAMWTDPTEAGKKEIEARVTAISKLDPAEQKQVDEWGSASRALERQAAVEATKNKNQEEATRLRTQANELAIKVRELKKAHQERVQPQIDDLRALYAMTNLKPGTNETAMGYKPDPKFPDRSKPAEIQVMMVGFFFKAEQNKVTPRSIWRDKSKEGLDFAALAKLLN